MTDPVKLYQDLSRSSDKPQSLQKILSEVLGTYLETMVLSPVVRSELINYQSYIAAAPLGKIATSYQFAHAVPTQITKLLELVEVEEELQVMGVGPVKHFRELSCSPKPKTLQQILSEILSTYLEKMVLIDEVRTKLEQYKKHLETAPLGNVVMGYPFPKFLPKQIVEMLNLAALREKSQLKAPHRLLLACENAVAIPDRSAKELYEQACRLEAALGQETLSYPQVEEFTQKIEQFIENLYRKFAEFIVNACDDEELDTLVSSHFPSDASLYLSKLNFFVMEIGGQIDFLTDSEFLKNFRKQSTLAEKLAFVDSYHDWFERHKAFSAELDLTLTCISSIIIDKAYESCKAKRQRLLDDPSLTVEDVNQQLSAWSTRAWKKHAKFDLINDLNRLLAEDQRVLHDWNTVSMQSQPTQRLPQPAYAVASLRYTLATPDIDPAELIVPIKQAGLPRSKSAFSPCDQEQHVEQGEKRPRSKSL